MEQRCPICDKHRGVGPLVGPTVWAEGLAVVTHAPAGADGTTALGRLFVETRRHVATLDGLTQAEAEVVGRAARRAARALRAELRP